jgi:poly(3-hydroxybutyrate) depolymerase
MAQAGEEKIAMAVRTSKSASREGGSPLLLRGLRKRGQSPTALLWFLVLLMASTAGPGLPSRGNGEEIPPINPRMEAFRELSLDLRCSYDGQPDNRGEVPYRLFLPRPYDPKASYPLIVWLHGWGDRGDDNFSQLKHMDATIYRGREEQSCPFFVLAPQCSRTPDRHWLTPIEILSDESNDVVNVRDMTDVTLNILEHIQRVYPIDRQRVVVLGISSGGSGCWELVHRQPHRFAAVVLCGAGAAPTENISSLLDTPIWAFHCAYDADVPVEGVESTIETVKANAGNVCLTKTGGVRHDCWTRAFANYDALNWLLQQRRGDASSPRPGRLPLRIQISFWWTEYRLHVLVLGILVMISYASVRHVKANSRAAQSGTGPLLLRGLPNRGHFPTVSGRRCSVVRDIP